MTTVFLDSGVFVEGMVAPWSAARALLILGAYRVILSETSEVVLVEVTRALERKGIPTNERSDFARLLRKLSLTVHARPSEEDVRQGLAKFLPLLHHRADVPVLVAAIAAAPDWLVSSNPDHFTPRVAKACGLRIVTPAQLMRYLGVSDVSQRTGGSSAC
ncbi:MAG: PIN domain-containing protein [Chloroflexi bacterium]|nr:PIN domain-containing protein [Chloroflexota bacterium]